VPIEASRWQRLQQCVRSSGGASIAEPRFEVGLLDTAIDFAELEQGWSKNFRKNLRRSARTLADQGTCELKVHRHIDDSQVEPLLMRAAEIEQRSWKAEAGSTILESEGMAQYYLQQFRWLAQRQELVVVFLELNGQAIAFEIGWLAKSVYHSFKVSYDQRYAPSSPGQLTMHLLLQQLIDSRECRAIDCLGPISEATSRFRPSTYTIGRLLIAGRSGTGRAMLAMYKNCMPQFRRWRRSRQS
jgi:CelD/BcsL family acetyltransferase involved in cellulose biosynthesis